MLPSKIALAEAGEIPDFTMKEKGLSIPRALNMGFKLSDSMVKILVWLEKIVFLCDKNTYNIGYLRNYTDNIRNYTAYFERYIVIFGNNIVYSGKYIVNLGNYLVNLRNYIVSLRNYIVSLGNYIVSLGNYIVSLGNYIVSLGNTGVSSGNVFDNLLEDKLELREQ